MNIAEALFKDLEVQYGKPFVEGLKAELEELQTQMATTSADVLRAEVVKRIIYKESDLIAIGTKIADVERFSDIAVQFAYPSELTASYPVAEGAAATEVGPITWTEFSLNLQKAVVAFSFTDEAKIAGASSKQLQITRRRAAEALAKAKDENILNTMLQNPHGSLYAATTWDTATTEQKVNDVITGIEWIIANSHLDPANTSFAVVLPASQYKHVSSVASVNGVLASVKDYVSKTYDGKVDFYMTRIESIFTFDSDADTVNETHILIAAKKQGVIHGVLETGKVPLAEEKREPSTGVTSYYIRQYFNTVVIPGWNSVVRYGIL